MKQSQQQNLPSKKRKRVTTRRREILSHLTVTPIDKDLLRSFIPIAPYPERLKAPKKNAQFAEILEVFKQVQINISFLDAIQQVPSYAKFLKDLVTIKRKTNVLKKAYLIEQVSSILQCKLPIKYKDPGCPTIACMIGVCQINRALLDLGASVNLPPSSNVSCQSSIRTLGVQPLLA
jgi:hypothetical protein